MLLTGLPMSAEEALRHGLICKMGQNEEEMEREVSQVINQALLIASQEPI